MPNHSIEHYLKNTSNWVEEFVIQLNLCPFARHPFQKGLIRFEVSLSADLEEKLTDFWKEIQLLLKKSPEQLSNTLLIYPKEFIDFEEFLGFFELCEQLLQMQNQASDFQLASFHPGYLFAETSHDAPRNFTNRSPYPMIHILRIEEVEKAIEQHPDTLEIPEINHQKMKEIGFNKLNKMLSSYLKTNKSGSEPN